MFFRSFRPRAPKYSYLVSSNPSSSKSTVGQGSSSYLFGKSDLSYTSSMANLPLASASSSQYDTTGRSHKYDDMEIYSTFRSGRHFIIRLAEFHKCVRVSSWSICPFVDSD